MKCSLPSHKVLSPRVPNLRGRSLCLPVLVSGFQTVSECRMPRTFNHRLSSATEISNSAAVFM